jgi:hypothetical protein
LQLARRVLGVKTILVLFDRLPTSQLLHHHLLLLLDSDVFKVSPLGQDLHSLNVLDGCKFISKVLVATKRIKVDFLTETFVLSLNDFKDDINLLTIVNLFIINSDN